MLAKRWVKVFLCILLTFSIAIPAHAQVADKVINDKNLYTDLYGVINNGNMSRVKGTARGRLLSSAELQISDDGNGVLGVYAETLCHVPVKQIYMVIYLEVWDEATQDWEYLSDYEYTWSASDFPDRTLTDVSVSFDIYGLRRGKTYSLRAYHMAKSDGGIMESMATETSGIVLD